MITLSFRAEKKRRGKSGPVRPSVAGLGNKSMNKGEEKTEAW